MTNLPRTTLRNAPVTISSCFRAARALAALAVVATLTGTASIAFAKTAQSTLPDRLAGPIDNSSRAPLVGSTSPRAMHSTDLGAVSPDTPLQGISLVFSRSAAQQADLAQLLTAQQTPGSSQYHQWLTPAQFGVRFGVSDNDLATTESWLQAQGFSIVGVSPSRDRITFSGPESAVEAAFGTPLHYFKPTSGTPAAAADLRTHIAPAHDLTLPATLSGMVLAVGNLADYRPQSHAIKRPVANFTSAQTGSNFLTPADVGTIYNIPSPNTGLMGSGQTIAIMGQTAVVAGDIANFQAAALVSPNTPVMTLIPNTGASTIFTGDEAESDLDLEYSSSIANKATVNFVYTGNSPNFGVFDSFIYAIEYGIGNIISLSYGQCEPDLGQSFFNEYESFFQQASAQGQTIINSAGDSGSSACYGDGSAASSQEQLAVSYPASSSYVTGLGGTEFPANDITSTNSNGVAVVGSNSATYWSKASGTDVISSALAYIPEMAWNDDAAALSASTSGGTTFSPSSGGGGVSIFEARPTWQSGTIGGVAIPSGSFRLVPDISLDSSPDDAGYLYCSSDNGTDGVGFAGSCTNGFRVSSAFTDSGDLTVAGGTSFAAPIFAGMLAIINQAKGYTTGQGNINPTLYTLAANSSTYSSAFHDITSGTNACSAGITVCGTGAQTSDYAAEAGYDEATGLGSVNLNNLIQAWPANTTTTTNGTGVASITVTPNTATPALNAADAISIQVSSSGTTPTGTVSVTDNGTAVAGSPFTLTNGAYTYTYTPTTACVHKLAFTYSGDSNYATTKTTTALVTGTCSIALTSSAINVTSGSSGATTLTVTPTGYTGTLALEVATVSSNLTNACYSGPATVKVTGTAAVTASYTIYTGVSACPSGSSPLRVGASNVAANKPLRKVPGSPWRNVPIPATFAGFMLVGCLRRRSRLLRNAAALGLSLVMVIALGVAGLGLTGCGNGAQGASTGTGTTTTGPTTYSIGIVAYDTNYTNITASTTVTVNVTN
jgi:subtilase family serine protease